MSNAPENFRAAIFDRIDADLIEPQRLASSVIDEVMIQRRKRDYSGRALTAREALQALKFEALVVSLSAQNLAHGISLEPDDLIRLMVAWARIDTSAAEAGV